MKSDEYVKRKIPQSEIKEIFQFIEKNIDNKEKLNEYLSKYKYPDGALPLFIREYALTVTLSKENKSFLAE